jgi:hypothetical protein
VGVRQYAEAHLPFILGLLGRKISAPLKFLLYGGVRLGLGVGELLLDPLHPGAGIVQFGEFRHRGAREQIAPLFRVLGGVEKP